MNKTYIIAEAGVNHNGNITIAKKMVDVAIQAGADAVKFQTFHPEGLASKFALKADYQKKSTGTGESQLEMLRKLMLTYDEFKDLALYCKEKKIVFISTPFDLESIDFLNQFLMPFWKIPSGEITNYPYLVKIAKTQNPIIMSTGMSDLFEIESAINVLKENGSREIRLLHCNTEYPTPFEDVNLQAMRTLRERFHVEVGYSDHTLGIEVPIAAVAMGATIIEKHFTLDCSMEGPDHKASLEPQELTRMVHLIRNIEQAIGSKDKKPTESEKKNIVIARKSIVACKKIKQGETLSLENITTKRPGSGLNPMRWEEVIGSQASRDFDEDELIEL